MKKHVVILILFYLAIISISISIFNFFMWPGLHLEESRAEVDFRYHFVMISRSTVTEYWQEVYNKAEQVAREQKIALQYFKPQFFNTTDLERFLETAILSQVDGILVSVPNTEPFLSLVNEAGRKGIPVITMVHDLEGTTRNAFVGIDPYELGYKTGLALSKAMDGKATVAALITSSFPETSAVSYLKGLEQAISPFPELVLKTVVRTEGGSISAEEKTREILKEYPNIDAIVCSDAGDTLGVARMVVDLNRVSRTTIVGYGLAPEIETYVQRGVIWGVLADNPKDLGEASIQSLLQLKSGKSIADLFYMPLYLIDATNVHQISYHFNTK